MREIITTGKTVEEATQKALEELGLSLEEAVVEVIEMPQRKLFRSTPAKVRVSADEPAPAEDFAHRKSVFRTSSIVRVLFVLMLFVGAFYGVFDTSTVSFSVGSTDDAGDTVYVKTSLSDDIVMVSAGLLSAFSTDVTHLYVMEEVPNASQVDRLSVSYGGKSLTLAYHEGGSDASYSSDYEWFIEEDGSTRAADEDAAAVATGAITVKAPVESLML